MIQTEIIALFEGLGRLAGMRRSHFAPYTRTRNTLTSSTQRSNVFFRFPIVVLAVKQTSWMDAIDEFPRDALFTAIDISVGIGMEPGIVGTAIATNEFATVALTKVAMIDSASIAIDLSTTFAVIASRFLFALGTGAFGQEALPTPRTMIALSFGIGSGLLFGRSSFGGCLCNGSSSTGNHCRRLERFGFYYRISLGGRWHGNVGIVVVSSYTLISYRGFDGLWWNVGIIVVVIVVSKQLFGYGNLGFHCTKGRVVVGRHHRWHLSDTNTGTILFYM